MRFRTKGEAVAATPTMFKADAEKQAADQGCDLTSALGQLVGKSLPMTLDITVDAKGTGPATMLLDSSFIKNSQGKPLTSEPSTLDVTYAGVVGAELVASGRLRGRGRRRRDDPRLVPAVGDRGRRSRSRRGGRAAHPAWRSRRHVLTPGARHAGSLARRRHGMPAGGPVSAR